MPRKGYQKPSHSLAAVIEQRENNLIKVLQTYCKDPGNCLAVGHYGDMIKLYLDNFRNWNYLNPFKVMKLGKHSNNGFLMELPFEKNGYSAMVALKSSKRPEADNLLYEYLVGKLFINKQLKKLPVFLETYDLYEYKSSNDHFIIDSSPFGIHTPTLKNLPNQIQPLNIGDLDKMKTAKDFHNALNMSCLKNEKICVSLQYFNRFTSFYSLVKNWRYGASDTISILFQVYFALHQLRDVYTHYDLHLENVMLYKPFPNKNAILMRYHVDGRIYEFVTEYIPKIIDYGRNFFNNGTITSKQLIEYVCKSPGCNPNCGIHVGYDIIQGSVNGGNTDKFYWIDPSKRNMSHDLRCAVEVFAINKLAQRYGLVTPTFTYLDMYGTPENTTKTPYYNHMNTVSDMFEYLKRIVVPIYAKFGTCKYSGAYKTTAIMDVYDDGRDFEFQLLPPNVDPKPSLVPLVIQQPTNKTTPMQPPTPEKKSPTPMKETPTPMKKTPTPKKSPTPKKKTPTQPSSVTLGTSRNKTVRARPKSHCQGQSPCLEENGCMLTKPGKIKAYCRKKPVTKTVKRKTVKKRKTPAKRTKKANA